jgi:hypothetical protein
MRKPMVAVTAVFALIVGLAVTTTAWAFSRGPATWSATRPSVGGGMMGGDAIGGGMMAGPGAGGFMHGAYGLAGNGRRVPSPAVARVRAQEFADSLGLRVGEVMQFSNNYYAELLTTSGRRATEVLVDPADGAVHVEYGPAMMWNSEYGMHRSGNEPAARVSADEARRVAQTWLNRYRSGLTAGEAEPFPGYYTLHTLKDGRVSGMLSVHATTGAVWYHVWHGRFVTMTEA